MKHWRSDKLQGKPEVFREKYVALPFHHHISQINCCGALWQEASKSLPQLQLYLLAHLPVLNWSLIIPSTYL